MRYTVLISLLMMLIHTTSVGETTNNLVSQDFTTGWTGTNVDTTHGSSTIAGVNGEYVVSDNISLSTDIGLNKPTINNGFTITGSSEIWFWNSYTQSVTQTITTTDDNDNVITQNRVIQGVQNGYQTYSDQLIISSNTQSDYEINLRYDFSVPGTTGHYGADLKNPSLTVEYTFKEELDSTIENQIVQLFNDFKPDEDIKFEEEIKMEEEFLFKEPIMDTMKEEDKINEPMFEEFAIIEDEEKEEEPIMNTVEMFEEDKEKPNEEKSVSELLEEGFKEEQKENEEEPESEVAESTESEKEESTEEVKQKETKTAKLETVLEKIDQQIKDIDKNLQLKNLVKLKVMSGDNILEVYNVPFYEPKDIYLDQLDITDNRVIYTQDLTQYKQNDPIFIQKQQLNRVLQERQNLIKELEILKNG